MIELQSQYGINKLVGELANTLDRRINFHKSSDTIRLANTKLVLDGRYDHTEEYRILQSSTIA
jgi:hypothetical protein